MQAASEVQAPPPPKVRGTQTALPTFLTSAKTSSDSFLPQNDLRLANTDITALRTGQTTASTLRNLAKASPDLSAGIFASNRMAISKNYAAIARNLNGTLNEEGTRLVQQLCRRFDLLGPTEGGFNHLPSIRSASESLSKELMLLGAAGVELILNKARVPEGIMPITVEKIKWKYSGKKKVPYQILGGEEISLDIPTFFYTALDQDLTTAYCESPVQASIQPILASQDFMNDLRRVFRRAIHPRVMAQIKEEMWRKNVPPEILHDPVKLKTFMDSTISALQNMLNGLNPEDALVMFDTLNLSYLTGGNTSLSKEYETLSQIINGKLSSGSKSMPVVLGHDATGSTNIASTQSMLFVKTVEGAVQLKLNEILSRALTMAVRLFGVDCVVEFKYESIDLRPDSELEAFKAMKQSRILEQLSLGLTSDAEASIELTGSLPLPGQPLLAGTRFAAGKQADPNANPTSNTSQGQGSAQNQALKPGTPNQAKS